MFKFVLFGALALMTSCSFGQKTPKAQVGKYVVELRIPDDGLFSQEEVDIEFRVMDSTMDDPVLGMAGVPNVLTSAAITMPEMPGMPVAKPSIHKEGVPGDYGLVAYFPHGGGYEIALTLTPPGGKPFKASFKVEVKDERPKGGKKPALPYTLELIDFPKDASAGQPLRLKMAIRDRKTKGVVKEFDVAHEREFHLMVVSKDLGWFIHEHPVQQGDGTWIFDWTFPAGGDYLVFADVAPAGMGSQILMAPMKLKGPKGSWPSKLAVSGDTSASEGIVARMMALGKPIPIGKMTALSFKLTREGDGKPLTDLEPYLGAMGHLMIIHQDGQTFVHSHPAEDAASEALSQGGEVRFSARFPRAGMYKAWAQFQRGGKVITLPFVFEVK